MVDRYNNILQHTKDAYTEFWMDYISVQGTYINTKNDEKFKIDRSFISHYTKLTFRKTVMLRQIELYKLDEIAPIEWVDFFDREYLTRETYNEYFLHRKGFGCESLLPGQLCNALGHYYCIEKIANDPSINIGMIIEDDIIFKKNFSKDLNKALSRVPSDWDIFCIGGSWYGGVDCCLLSEEIKLAGDKHPLIYKPAVHTVATGNYLINKRSAKLIIQHRWYKPFSHPIDWNLCHIARDLNLKVYWCRPFLSFEGSKRGHFNTSV